MHDTLLPISEFIELARRQGANFDGKDAKVHLAYLTKLGLLPHAIKRKLDGQIQGCYPTSALAKLLEIQALKQTGMTYSQIAKSTEVNSLELVDQKMQLDRQPSSILNPLSSDFVLHVKPSNVAYLVLGLIIGVIISTLNTNGLAAMTNSSNVALNQSAQIGNAKDNSDLYLIAVPKQNLDKLGKTNINYLIKN